MAAKDDVDMESLQAQIDMSMSFAHDLVTSWMKPTHLAQLRSSGSNATQILEEELRRPPRLGVGASIPTAPPLAHEASKLKCRLGKNGTKDESATGSQPQDHPKSDDEEHKGRPVKRKTNPDPFGREGKKKKKRKAESIASSHRCAENAPKPVSLPMISTFGEPAKESQGYPICPSMQHSGWNLPDSFSGKEKQRMTLGDQWFHVTEGQRSATLMDYLPPVRLPVQTTFSPSLTAYTVHSHSEPSRETSAPVPGNSTNPEGSRAHANFMPIPDKTKRLGTPLLNLDGPPELTDKPGNSIVSNNTRKKRKRRKKKHQTIAGTGDK